MKRIVTLVIMTAMLFCGLPMISGNTVDAASPYWRNVSAKATSGTTATVSWKALSSSQRKKITSITVFRNGKAVKVLSKTASSFKDAGLTAGATYSYQLKTVKKITTYSKMWYNKSTRSYQKSRPPKRSCGKRRTFKTTTYSYANASPVVKVTTPKPAVTDKTAPTTSVTSTNNVAASQTVTLKATDAVGVTKYYWGTKSNPAENEYTAVTKTTSMSVTKTVTAAGTYYFFAKDAAGNRSASVSKVFYKTSFTVTNGSVNPTAVITMAGNSFALPKVTANSNYKAPAAWKNNGTSINIGASYKPTGNVTMTAACTANSSGTTTGGNTGGTTTPSTKYVDIVDFMGTTRNVVEGSADYNNPLYNRKIDGTFKYSGRKFVQKGGVTFMPDYCSDEYAMDVYNGDAKKVTFELSRQEKEFTKWDNRLDNPSSEKSYYILGDHGRRLAEVTHRMRNANCAAVHLSCLYFDIGTVKIVAKYNGTVIDNYSLLINNDGAIGSDGFDDNYRSAYAIAKKAVALFDGGGGIESRLTQEDYQKLKAQMGEYYARMKAIEAYVAENYTYNQMSCNGGYAILKIYSVVDYGEYGDWVNPTPQNTGHVAFRPYSYCDKGMFNKTIIDYEGQGWKFPCYFQTNGHH